MFWSPMGAVHGFGQMIRATNSNIVGVIFWILPFVIRNGLVLKDNELLRLMKKYGSGHCRQVAAELPRRRSFWDIQRRYRLLYRVR